MSSSVDYISCLTDRGVSIGSEHDSTPREERGNHKYFFFAKLHSMVLSPCLAALNGTRRRDFVKNHIKDGAGFLSQPLDLATDLSSSFWGLEKKIHISSIPDAAM